MLIGGRAFHNLGRETVKVRIKNFVIDEYLCNNLLFSADLVLFIEKVT